MTITYLQFLPEGLINILGRLLLHETVATNVGITARRL